ncbi:MAG: hypothetical protein WCR36_06215 [Bacteroidaceae bacterium]
MKKLFYIASLFAFVLSSCSPMSDIYDDLDVAQAKEEVTAKFYNARMELPTEYTLTEDDYTVSPNADVAQYKNFSASLLAKDNIPALLDAMMVYGQAGTDYTITYNYYKGSLSYLHDIADFYNKEVYTLTDADYESMKTDAGDPGAHHNFSDKLLPAAYLPPFLLAKYPAAVSGAEQAISYKYYSNYVTSVVNSVWSFDGTAWTEAPAPSVPSGVSLFVLESADYDMMLGTGNYGNLSSSDSPDHYLPIFLGIKKPFALEGDKICVVYKYYSNKVTASKADEYTYTNGMWTKYSSNEDRSLSVAWSMDTQKWAYQPPFQLTLSEATVATAGCVYTLAHADYDLTGHGSYNNFAYYDNDNNFTLEYLASEISKMLKASSTLPVALEQGQIWAVTFNYYDKDAQAPFVNGDNTFFFEVGLAE